MQMIGFLKGTDFYSTELDVETANGWHQSLPGWLETKMLKTALFFAPSQLDTGLKS